MVRLLLQAGAGVDVETYIKGFGQVTPLMLAAGQGHEEIARELLAHGAEVNVQKRVEDGGRMTPLMLAARKGVPGIVEALLAAGADPTRAGDDGRTALDLAREKQHAEVVALLEPVPVEGVDLDEGEPAEEGMEVGPLRLAPPKPGALQEFQDGRPQLHRRSP